MRVALTFRLYMMRYGNALLASSYTNPSRNIFSEDVCKKVAVFLTEKREVPGGSLKHFKDYLYNKPGSPRYTPLRQAIERGQPLKVEHQDLLLADSTLQSSVGALTQDYFDDALSLAHTLKLVKKNQNLLLARGRLSLSTGWAADDPFQLGDRDALYLGLWLLDIDCDWLWAFLGQIPDDSTFEITVENRVELLLKSWKHVLSARQIRSGHPHNAKIRTRLNELMKITERNVREKLNLGQPWSWFLIPRLELLVDAGILRKKERHGLTRYSLTSAGRRFRSLCDPDESGEVLIRNYFFCRDVGVHSVAERIEWEAIEKGLETVASELRTSVGYFPIFETATALCVEQYMNLETTNEPIWEIEKVKKTLWEESKSSTPKVRLAIDRQGQIYAFKPE
ncbi:MAG: hypothetical protein QGF64_05710 [Candidatus Poseidoniia archaeon]|nr:hypothetical protein [Candidatus Poseidoniia archaeon]